MGFVRIRGLSKTFGGRRPVVAVDDVSLDVQQGELVTLLGPSGCGKTTTLRCVAGLERPTTGAVAIGAEVVVSVTDGIFVPPEKRGLGMVFQSYAVWPHMTVYQNVVYPLEVKSVPLAQAKGMVERALALVDLVGYEDRFPTQLSGGQQQRVALARAIVGEPRVLLFDEPLSNLDAKLRERTRFELVELQRRIGCTSIYVTHDQAEAMVISDRIVVMNQGKVQQIGTAREVYEQPANEFVADFIGIANFVPGTIASSPTAGFVRVATALGEVHAAAVMGADATPDILLSIRPEWIELSDRPPGRDCNTWRGEIDKAAYVGHNYEYVVRVNDLSVRVRTGAGRAFARGDPVSLYFPPERCVVVPRSAEAHQAPASE